MHALHFCNVFISIFLSKNLFLRKNMILHVQYVCSTDMRFDNCAINSEIFICVLVACVPSHVGIFIELALNKSNERMYSFITYNIKCKLFRGSAERFIEYLRSAFVDSVIQRSKKRTSSYSSSSVTTTHCYSFPSLQCIHCHFVGVLQSRISKSWFFSSIIVIHTHVSVLLLLLLLL